MKFLCLHGMGTNSEVLEAQLAPIRAYMGPMHEFFFLDGQIECKAADGMSPRHYNRESTRSEKSIMLFSS